MRRLLMTLVMAGLICLPVLAQFPFGGMMRGMSGGNAMLTSKDIQKELKLTEDQIKTITDSQSEMMQAMRAAFQDGDREAITKAQEDQTKAMQKLRDGFTAEQKKRFFQLELQSAAKSNSAAIFSREDVQKALKFTSEQKEKVKASLSELEGDVKELMEDARGDFSRMRETMTKIQGLNKDTFDKISKSLSETQKTTWKELQGEPFKGEFQPAFGKGKGKKRDDF